MYFTNVAKDAGSNNMRNILYINIIPFTLYNWLLLIVQVEKCILAYSEVLNPVTIRKPAHDNMILP